MVIFFIPLTISKRVYYVFFTHIVNTYQCYTSTKCTAVTKEKNLSSTEVDFKTFSGTALIDLENIFGKCLYSYTVYFLTLRIIPKMLRYLLWLCYIFTNSNALLPVSHLLFRLNKIRWRYLTSFYLGNLWF